MIRDMSQCGACRTCEMACSFHHTGEFSPARSAIRIVEKKDGAGYQVLLVEDGSVAPCDGCAGRTAYLCMDYCKGSEELKEIIEEYLKKKREEEEKA